MNIIAQIEAGAVKVWDQIEQDIDADAAKVKAVLGASSHAGFDTFVASVKQGASNTLGTVTTIVDGAAPVLASTVETAANAELTANTGGLALPLVGMTDTFIDSVVAKGIAAFNAWSLKTKAALAENNTISGAQKAA